ncbi:MAG: DUF1351 domain-containing protein [Oscillospiraceae bacterium]|jgi:hypothetical protein
MEFIVKTDLEKSLPSAIDFNYEEMKKELSEKLTHYNNLVVTEDSIKAAKDDKALLNKLSKAINDKKIEVKKQCLAPFEDFEKKCKELISMIDSPVKAIDTQIKAFDEIKQNEKFAELERFFNENIGELVEVISVEKVLNPKWRNAGEKVESLKAEMLEKIDKASNDLKIITAFKSEFETVIKDTYLSSFDMSAALAEKNRLEERKAKLEEIKRQQEKQKAQEQPPEPKPVQTPIQTVTPVVADASNVFDVTVTLLATTSEFRAEMKALCDKHNIARKFN